jgi:hypothetical protein
MFDFIPNLFPKEREFELLLIQRTCNAAHVHHYKDICIKQNRPVLPGRFADLLF